MSVHLHRTRQWTAWALIATGLSPFALCFASVATPRAPLSRVTGRVTISGRPFDGTMICLDSGGTHSAFGWVGSDGTFRLSSLTFAGGGAEPGRYRAHFFSPDGGRSVPSQYTDPKTSGIEINVASDWNDFRIDLP